MACFQREWTLIKRTAFIYVGPCCRAARVTYRRQPCLHAVLDVDRPCSADVVDPASQHCRTACCKPSVASASCLYPTSSTRQSNNGCTCAPPSAALHLRVRVWIEPFTHICRLQSRLQGKACCGHWPTGFSAPGVCRCSRPSRSSSWASLPPPCGCARRHTPSAFQMPTSAPASNMLPHACVAPGLHALQLHVHT